MKYLMEDNYIKKGRKNMSKIEKILSRIAMKYLMVPRPPVVDARKKKIACIGDSITFGAGVNGKMNKTWEHYLEEKLEDDWQVLNYGISGRTLLKGGDYPYTEEKFYSISQGIKADIYILMLGTNDSKPYNWNEKLFGMELNEMVEEYLKIPNQPKVVLMTPPTCFEDEKLGKVAFDINNDIIGTEIYRIVKQCGETHRLDVIDLNQYTKSHSEWFVDGVHPNSLGNERIAECIWTMIFKE